MNRSILIGLLLIAMIALSEAAFFSRMKSKGEDIVDDAQDAALRLKRKGGALADDLSDSAKDVKERGQSFAARKKREYVDDSEESIDRRGWRVPIFSGIADRFRRNKRDTAPDVDTIKGKARRFSDDVTDKVQEKKKEWLESDDESILGSIGNKLRRGRKNIVDNVDDASDKLKQRGGRYSKDAADKIKNQNRKFSDESDIDDDSSFVGRIAKKFNRKGSELSGDFDENVDDMRSKGKKFSKKAADTLKQKNRKFQKHSDIDERGFFGRMANKFRSNQRDLSEDIEDQADNMKQKGKKFGDTAAKKLKEKKAEWTDL